MAVWLRQVAHGHQHVFDQNGTYSGDVFEREAVVILPTQLCCRWSLPKQKNTLGSRGCQGFDWRALVQGLIDKHDLDTPLFLLLVRPAHRLPNSFRFA